MLSKMRAGLLCWLMLATGLLLFAPEKSYAQTSAQCASTGAWVNGTFNDGPRLCAIDLNNNNQWILAQAAANQLTPGGVAGNVQINGGSGLGAATGFNYAATNQTLTGPDSTTWSTNGVVFPAPSGAKGSFQLTPGTAPTSPPNGTFWVTSSGAFAEVNGSVAALGVTVPTAAAAGSNTQAQYNCSAVLCGSANEVFSGTTTTFANTLTLPDTSSWVSTGLTLASTKTLTLSDGGTFTSAVNTFHKTVTNTVTASGVIPAFSLSSSSTLWGCIYSSGANLFSLGIDSSANGSCINPVMTWGSSIAVSFPFGLTSAGTITLPDTGTHTINLNTFVKPTTDSNSATAGSPAFTWSSPSGSFGCLYSSVTSTYDLGSTSAAGGACSNSTFEWTSTTALLSKATTINAAGNPPLTIQQSGSTVAIFTNSGAIPQWQLPNTGAITSGGGSISANGASGAAWNFGNGTPGDKSGTIQAATANLSTAINGPSVAGGNVDIWSTTVYKTGHFINFQLGNGNVTTQPGSGNGFIGMDNTNLGMGMYIRGGANGKGTGEVSPFSPYAWADTLQLWPGQSQYPVLHIESGGAGQDAVIEIGANNIAGTMGQITSVVLGDRIAPLGALQHVTVTNGGSGYVQATTTATFSGGGCTVEPGAAQPIVTGGVVTVVWSKVIGYGCTSPPTVTISDTSGGTGATATTTIVTTGGANVNTGPSLVWHSFADSYWISGFTGFGYADSVPGPDINDLRFGENGNWENAFDKVATSQPYLRFAGGITFEVGNTSAFLNGESAHDCGNQAGIATGVMCVTPTAKGGSTVAGAGIMTGFYRTSPVTVANLSTLDPTPTTGDAAFVSDATSCAFGSTVSGGGSNGCPVHYSGIAWVGG